MGIVWRVLAAVWRGAVGVVWGSAPDPHDQRPGRPLATTSVELERARLRSASTSSTMGGGL